MAKNSIRDYDATAANNTDVQSTDISEGCAASGINNAIREVMADLKDVSTGTVALETPSADQLNVDNIRIDGNTISSTDTNGDITLDPDGTGDVIVASGNLGIGTASPATRITAQTVATLDGTDGGAIELTVGGSSAGELFSSSSETVLSEYRSNKPLAFRTNNTERMRIHSNGALTLKTTQTNPYDTNQAGLAYGHAGDYVLRNTGTGSLSAVFNQQTEGSLLLFAHAGTTEGSISVSGTTVSYNGGHLARWSQLADNTKDTSIVKGTVMTNLDQMAVWHHEAQSATYYEEGDELPEGVSVGDEKTPAVAAYDEDNEQLNCMAVSSVEGDANVAGVFVNWDDDDEDYTADMNIAMTGDMVIRIASGTTVARGDLLMSAGDGTAKPQGDDIVRSKTIAKVTSTTVSHTYDDGSYLVPCVLMAC